MLGRETRQVYNGFVTALNADLCEVPSVVDVFHLQMLRGLVGQTAHPK